MDQHIKIFSEKAGEVLLSPAPPTLSDPGCMLGVKSLGANGPLGHLLLQEIAGNGYCIRYQSYFLNQDDNITLALEKPALRLCLALKNSFYSTTKEFGERVLHERGFNITYTPSLHPIFRLHAKQPYIRVDIFFSLDHLQQLSQHFPVVEKFLHEIKSQQPALLNQINQVANEEILTVMKDILYCAYPQEMRKKYIDNKIMEILILALEKLTLYPKSNPILLPEEIIANIYKARELLVKDLKRKYTLDELASLVNLRTYKLKQGFIDIYGLSVSDFIHEARMQKARLLLEETDLPIFRIATDTGYNHPFSFSAAFKKHFGYAPSLIQRSRKCAAQNN